MFLFNGKTLVNTSKILASVIYLEFLGTIINEIKAIGKTILHLLIFISIYILLSQSLSLAAGYSGLISLAHVGFYGIGAYTAAILSVKYSVPFLATLPMAMLLSGLIAIVVSAISLRTVDDYFIIITLGIQVVIFSVMNNWQGAHKRPSWNTRHSFNQNLRICV